MSTIEYTIDAKGKMLGRLASEVAVLLMGKNLPNFSRDTVADVKVTIINAAELNPGAKAKADVEYTHYTGFPGGLKRYTRSELSAKKGNQEIIRKAIEGMIPRNKIRPVVMKNLTIND